MKHRHEMMMLPIAHESQSRRNLRLALMLAAIALAFFIGYILHSWLPRP